jgi:RNA polymerase sigma factor (sigma-70 family)
VDGSPASDARLVEAALGGDKDAFAALVTRHWATAVALAARVLGTPDLARDAAQEAAVAALVGLDRLRAPARFGAWFCGITLNVARGWVRQLRAERPAARGQEPDPPSPEPGPDERAELADLAATVRAAVAQLADGQRDAVLLFYLQGLTHREVAAELAISVGAVKARLHQARAALTPALVPLASGPAHVGAPTLTSDPARTSDPAVPVTRSKEPVMTTTAGGPAWAEVSVTDIRSSDDSNPMNRTHVMVLVERDGPRRLPIWVGPVEATVLALSLQAVEMPRPMTYQMTAGLLEASGSRVSEVRITRLAGEVFYAVVVVDGPAGQREVDARPSDAVNLALVAGAPILADGALLDDPRASRRDEWQDLPSGTAALAAEAVEWKKRFTPAASPHVGPGGQGQVQK